MHADVRSHVFSVHTGSEPAVLDLTGEAADFVADLGSGLLTIFIPHATAGIAILELGSGSDEDLLAVFDELLPVENRYLHAHGSTGHGRSHVMPAFISPSVVVPVIDGRLTLGTWQSLALVDLNVDNARRSVRLTFIGG
jgi:secondary thiamine-phosphate synthase enzyme